jgi:hypothetical protein
MSQTGNRSAATNHHPPSPETPGSNDGSNGCLWDVQEILAERTSITGENELLVVWKTSWIPKSNMIPDGPVMMRFESERKWKFGSAAGNLQIPVQGGTTLMWDCATAVLRIQSAREQRNACAQAEAEHRRTKDKPRRQQPAAMQAGGAAAPRKRQNNDKK